MAGVSTHSRLKAAGLCASDWRCNEYVSTHSRLKAAGKRAGFLILNRASFNTQPPEGGWTD